MGCVSIINVLIPNKDTGNGTGYLLLTVKEENMGNLSFQSYRLTL